MNKTIVVVGRTIDFKKKQDILSVQMMALEKHLNFIRDKSPYYNNLTGKLSVDTFTDIPFTNKSDLEKRNNEFLAVPSEEVVEYVTTSGTLGNPITIALTKSDLERLAYNESRSLDICGVSKSDTIQITTTLDKRFMAGMAYYLGATRIGAAVVRSGIGDMEFQVDNIKRFNPTVLIAVPSFVYKLGKYLSAQNFDINKSSIRKIIGIGEAIRTSDLTPNTLLKKTNAVWGTPIFSTYASTEMATAFTECEYGNGGHIIPELIYVEIVDDDGNRLPNGELGEVVATPLNVEGMPLLRYKTGDLARIHDTPCPCGRNTPRLGPIEGRKDQMIKYKGTTLFPEHIQNVLHNIDAVDNYLIELSSNKMGLDHVKILIPDNVDKTILQSVDNELAEKLRVRPEISAVSMGEIKTKAQAYKSRKPRKFIDIRTAEE